MFPPAPGSRVSRQTAGAVGAVALIALGASPVAAEDATPGLVLGEMAPFEGVKPGSTFAVPASFTNTGSEALAKVWLSYEVSHGLSHTELPSNCLAWKVGGFDEIPVSTKAVCAFDQTVKPGVVYAPEKALTVGVLDSALYDSVNVVASAQDNSPGDEASSGPVRGTGPVLKLAEQPDATPAAPGSAENEDWDAQKVAVNAANTADFQVTGARLKGRVGDTVDLTVKFTNAGPGWMYRGTVGTPATQVLIKMPAGTTVTKGHGYCDKLPSGTYECGTSQAWVDEGDGETYTFKLRIDKAVPGAKGSVALEAKPRPFDRDKANDAADITLDVAGADGGSTGGGGTTTSGGGAGSPSTGGTGVTGGSGTTDGSSTGGGSSTTGASTTGATNSATTGDLASTGSGSTLPLAGAAVAAVGIGAGAVLVVRRRRAAGR
ncbi:hypothetical protein ACM01_00035 [Streptomyces viridochromogenes]|uniref:Gram-positive cocci surface proteins LPxTG domain-containing protein n=1 Tax=Streptomyces viridochromogenes TaxID=1938 RepID=A0A0J8CGG9_STRVR|nr:hypothetical protein ACM01_00035 [Streptomyces viridochromogenes]KOG09323.1 hypothetical protein ADK35_39780 [Streptomyces viridochromogenes]KOG27230.1 hypothetical protein ADK36_01345 [Streptomyces viridochromogenes]